MKAADYLKFLQYYRLSSVYKYSVEQQS